MCTTDAHTSKLNKTNKIESGDKLENWQSDPGNKDTAMWMSSDGKKISDWNYNYETCYCLDQSCYCLDQSIAQAADDKLVLLLLIFHSIPSSTFFCCISDFNLLGLLV